MNEQEKLSFTSKSETDEQKIVCLGLNFNSENERREYFRNELRKKLPQLKKIQGFPIGEDEDIIALSDPPYYTACPNPWINDFIAEWETEKNRFDRDELKYKKEPYAGDVSAGKNDAVYNAHTYHTKVPPKAILNYLLHYTLPGDIVYDGFSGTGMTGVASIFSNDLRKISETSNRQLKSSELESLKGSRKVILSDLSPIATFIANNYNNPLDIIKFESEANHILNKLEEEFGWMYTTHSDENKSARINYTVWSDVFNCPVCNSEIIFHKDATDKDNNKVLKSFTCKNCNSQLTKKELIRSWEHKIDPISGDFMQIAKTIPVMICYKDGRKNRFKQLDDHDIQVLNSVDNIKINSWFPTDRMPLGDESRRNDRTGITHVHHFYTKRNLFLLSKFYEKIMKSPFKNQLLLLFTSHLVNLSKLNRYRPEVSFPYNPLSGTLYIGSRVSESNVFEAYRNKIKKITDAFIASDRQAVVSLHSQAKVTNINDNSVDYIFTDPPFGANIMYSELSFLWESWIKIKTNNTDEAIINKSQHKGLPSYHKLMKNSFEEYYRILKPGKWITIEFSNSKASIWNSIQDSIQQSGFIIADVSALDKQMGSFKAVTSTIAVKQDLVISAYKPLSKTIEKIKNTSNSKESVWLFISQHLDNLPILHLDDLHQNYIVERTPRILFDRMVAYHVQNNLSILMSSSEFQSEITQKFPIRDGMIFLDSQIAEYDKKRISIKDFSQISLFVSDENSAIEWIRQQLMKKSQTRQDLHPYFMKEIQHIAKHEQLPELDDLLSQNFLRFDDEEGSVPTQILTYLRRNYPDLRGLDASHPSVIKKALNRWYVPDPNKQADLEKLREKALLREFNLYVEEMTKSKKKLKVFRTEAIRAGFKKAWSEKEFQTIITVGDRLPETIIQEDDKLLMYYDNAQIKLDM